MQGSRKNEDLINLINELRDLLAPLQDKPIFPTKSKWPIGFIVGCPRSGSTLFLQFLASTQFFSYPTNILARFAYSPYIGALIQKLLFDPKFDSNDAFTDLFSKLNFESVLGKSKGALATNEFQHFFRNFMPYFELKHLTKTDLKKVNCNGISKGLISIEQAFEKPFITKAGILQFNIDYFSRKFANIIWLKINRDPLKVMQSIALARLQCHGDINEWWSVKPKEYPFLKKMDSYHQIAGQVYFTEKAINDGLKNISDLKKLSVSYELLCNDPQQIYEMIKSKYLELGITIDSAYKGPSEFKSKSDNALPHTELIKYEKAFSTFQKNPTLY